MAACVSSTPRIFLIDNHTARIFNFNGHKPRSIHLSDYDFDRSLVRCFGHNLRVPDGQMPSLDVELASVLSFSLHNILSVIAELQRPAAVNQFHEPEIFPHLPLV